jgi:hypothetical protein
MPESLFPDIFTRNQAADLDSRPNGIFMKAVFEIAAGKIDLTVLVQLTEFSLGLDGVIIE